jgi:DnaA family protein
MSNQQLPLQFEFRANQTFADYFSGNNGEALTHLQNCIAGNGEQQIFIWGEKGLGKSHLLQACCHQAQSQGNSSFYFSLIKNNLPDPSLLIELDNFDVVCFDNMDVIAGNRDWEIAFFNFFNQHRDRENLLILSAERAPNDLGIELADLRTRLNWGLTLRLYPLADDSRVPALIFKADLMGFEIAPQVGRFLLAHYDKDLNSLWSLLAKLDEASLAAKRKLTIPFLKKILDEELS